MTSLASPNPQNSRQPLQLVLLPFQRFFRAEASSGILLIACMVIALVWANSPVASHYFALWESPVSIGLGQFELSKPLILWINDGLMAIFFLVVGLEIKRELLAGELSSVRQAALPIAAAIGGMVLPALIYIAMNPSLPESQGWAIPMATDIALALGVLSLVGRRAALPLRIFLAALAIVDDIGAVVVIALFYTAQVVWPAVLASLAIMGLLVFANLAGVRHPLAYGALGVVLWIAILQTGVHATLAGVLLALTIPPRTAIDPEEFLAKGRAYLMAFERASSESETILSNKEQRAAVQAMEIATREVESPLQRMEHGLHPWVAYLIVPLFALANAGIRLGGHPLEMLSSSVTLGIVGGLLIGKPMGILIASWLAVRLGISAIPFNVSWRQIFGVAWLAGIGFTMSIFIANLAFGLSPFVREAKIGILFGSILAGIAGWLIVRRSSAGLRGQPR